MGLSHWKDPDSRVAYERAYASAMELWPIPFESISVPTPFGDTHVVVSGARDGEPVVLLHAASLTATQWYLQAEALGRTHRLYAIDLMGDIGLSRQAAPIHTRREAADWLAGTLDALDIRQAAFVGSSFGGFQSTNLATFQPKRVRSLALLAPAATLRPFKLLANMFIRTGSLLPLPATVKPGLRGMLSGGLPHAAIVRQMELGVAGFRYDRAGIYPTEIPDDELAAIDHQVLVLLGDREMIYDPAAAAERARRLFRRATVEIIAGVGHLLGMQRPELVNARLLEHLDGAPSPVPAGSPAEVS